MIALMIGVILFILLLIASLLGFLFHYWFFSADSPDKAWVFVDIAGRYKTEKGHLLTKTDAGEVFKYGNNQIVAIPNNRKFYPVKYWKRRRVLGVCNGNIVASPLGDKQLEHEIGQETLIKELTLSHIGSDMVRAMSSAKVSIAMILIVIVITAIVIGGGIFAFNQFQKQSHQQVPATPTTPIILPPSGEVK